MILDTPLQNRSFIKPMIAFFALLAFAQIAAPLPFTPIPLTGQTFALMLFPFFLSEKETLSATSLYIFSALCGLPVLASFQTFSFGPSFGYILGFLPLVFVLCRYLKMTLPFQTKRSFFLFALLSSTPLWFGASFLLFFVSPLEAITLGVIPFLFGEFLKASCAFAIGSLCKPSLSTATKE